MSRVLVVDDEQAIGWSLKEMLSDDGHDVDLAATVGEAVAAAASHAPAVILLDVRLPGRDGIDGIPDLRTAAPAAAIVVMTAFGDLETAVRAVRAGAFDYLVKPFELEHVSEVVGRALVERRSAGDAEPVSPALVGSCPAMQEVFKRIAVVAASDLPVLVAGPAGSGKQLAARAIHAHSRRREKPLLTTNLAALAPAAVGRELFGSDADPGLFARAAGGTLVIESIEAAAGDVQSRLARLLEPRPAAVASDVRMIATTRRDPARLGLDDLLADRLRSLVVVMPSLADRRSDLPAIVNELLARHAAATGSRPPQVSPEFLAALQARDWPGNVRDLKAAVEHAAVIARGAPLVAGLLPPPAAATAAPVAAAGRQVDAAIRDWAAAARVVFGDLPEPDLHHRTLRLVEATLLREALAHSGGNRTAAAKLLGLDRATLRTKLRQLGIDD